jgi:hypothetical protein
VYFQEAQRLDLFDLVRKIKRDEQMLPGITIPEAFQIYYAVKSTERVPGDLAEVGVYTGGSARIICEARAHKALHLFDTFEGLPSVDPVDTTPWNGHSFAKGQYRSSLDRVSAYLTEYADVHFYVGVFPETGDAVRDRRFAFVHLDVDTFRSTLEALSFFYPRMSPGGIIISHDYASSKGVRTAFGSFLNDRMEPLVELSGNRNQCLMVKR